MPSRGTVSRPWSRFQIKHQWASGTSDILEVIKKAAEEEQRLSSLRPLISSSIKCKRMQPGPPQVLMPGPVGLFCRQVMMLSTSHPVWTVSIQWLHFSACSPFAPIHSWLSWRRSRHNQKRRQKKKSLFLQKNNMAKNPTHKQKHDLNYFKNDEFKHFTVCYFPRVESHWFNATMTQGGQSLWACLLSRLSVKQVVSERSPPGLDLSSPLARNLFLDT